MARPSRCEAMKQARTVRAQRIAGRRGPPFAARNARVINTRPPSGRTPVRTATPKPAGRHAAAHTSALTSVRLGGVLLGACFGDRLLAAAALRDRALDLPARLGLCRPHQPDDERERAQEQARDQAGALPEALAIGQPGRAYRGQEPYVSQVERFHADVCEQESHAPRYALCTSGFSRSFSESSLSVI